MSRYVSCNSMCQLNHNRLNAESDSTHYASHQLTQRISISKVYLCYLNNTCGIRMNDALLGCQSLIQGNSISLSLLFGCWHSRFPLYGIKKCLIWLDLVVRPKVWVKSGGVIMVLNAKLSIFLPCRSLSNWTQRSKHRYVYPRKVVDCWHTVLAQFYNNTEDTHEVVRST